MKFGGVGVGRRGRGRPQEVRVHVKLMKADCNMHPSCGLVPTPGRLQTAAEEG